MPLYQSATQPAAERPRPGFTAAFNLQSELRQEAESSAPNSNSSSCGQEHSFTLLLCWSPLMMVPEAAVTVCSNLFYTAPQQKCHIDDDASVLRYGTTSLM
ncbi:hypothetical protein ABVT39_024566 [Epinephelus coioides]